MKKSILSAAILMLIISTSCKKSYTCTCTKPDSNGLYTIVVSSSTIKSKSQSDAESECVSKSSGTAGCRISN